MIKYEKTEMDRSFFMWRTSMFSTFAPHELFEVLFIHDSVDDKALEQARQAWPELDEHVLIQRISSAERDYASLQRRASDQGRPHGCVLLRLPTDVLHQRNGAGELTSEIDRAGLKWLNVTNMDGLRLFWHRLKRAYSLCRSST